MLTVRLVGTPLILLSFLLPFPSGAKQQSNYECLLRKLTELRSAPVMVRSAQGTFFLSHGKYSKTPVDRNGWDGLQVEGFLEKAGHQLDGQYVLAQISIKRDRCYLRIFSPPTPTKSDAVVWMKSFPSSAWNGDSRWIIDSIFSANLSTWAKKLLRRGKLSRSFLTLSNARIALGFSRFGEREAKSPSDLRDFAVKISTERLHPVLYYSDFWRAGLVDLETEIHADFFPKFRMVLDNLVKKYRGEEAIFFNLDNLDPSYSSYSYTMQEARIILSDPQFLRMTVWYRNGQRISLDSALNLLEGTSPRH